LNGKRYHKSVVEGGIDVSHRKHFLTRSSYRPKSDGLLLNLFLPCLPCPILIKICLKSGEAGGNLTMVLREPAGRRWSRKKEKEKNTYPDWDGFS